jgi:N-acetylmuramoyl-L-alanine amidase
VGAVAGDARAASGQASVVDVRLGVHPAKTRFVLELTETVDFRIFTLPDPYRAVIDFSSTDWRREIPVPAGSGLILRFRHGPYQPGTTRLVVDLSGPARVREAFMLPAGDGRGPRFVLDLEPATPQVFAAEANRVQGARIVDPDTMAAVAGGAAEVRPTATARTGLPVVVASTAASVSAPPVSSRAVMVAAAAVAAPPVPPPIPPARSKPKTETRRLIALDPGHGGADPGAISVSGTYEKNITLAVARILRTELEATGRYRVLLTRTDDVFIRLRDRVAFARDAGADLFMSLHADSIDSREMRGMSVYSLSDKASDREAATLAARENRADALGGVDLGAENDEVASILIDLAQRDSRNQSRRFANLLVGHMSGPFTLVPRPHRSAGFAVLTAPDVPSVLLEMGYLSSPKDALLLERSDHRKRLARSIVKSIDAYFAARKGSGRS